MSGENVRCSYIHRDERGAEQCTAEAVKDGRCEVHQEQSADDKRSAIQKTDAMCRAAGLSEGDRLEVLCFASMLQEAP